MLAVYKACRIYDVLAKVIQAPADLQLKSKINDEDCMTVNSIFKIK